MGLEFEPGIATETFAEPAGVELPPAVTRSYWSVTLPLAPRLVPVGEAVVPRAPAAFKLLVAAELTLILVPAPPNALIPFTLGAPKAPVAVLFSVFVAPAFMMVLAPVR